MFLLCTGVVQVAASYGGLKGLLLCNSRAACAVLGTGLILGSLVWFFFEGGRNIPDTNGGIAGASQFGLFVLGGFLALLFTFVTTSLTNRRNGGSSHTADGLPSLSETTYLQALSSNLGALWKYYRRRTQRHSSG